MFDQLPYGYYTVFVKDTNNCYDLGFVMVDSLEQPKLEVKTNRATTCKQSNGRVEFNVVGGAGTLLYSLNGGDYRASSVFDSLPQGMHLVQVIDSVGCTDELEFFIDAVPEASFVEIKTDNPRCEEENGSILIRMDGVSGPYLYSIDGGLKFFADSLFLNLDTGNYELVVMDTNGCTLDSIIRLEFYENPSISSIEINPEICDNQNGAFIVHANGVSGLFYSVNNGPFTNDTVYTNLDSGLYHLIVSDSLGCTVDTNIFINHLERPVIDSIDSRKITCGSNNGVLEIFASSAQQPLLYSIDGGTNFSTNSKFTQLSFGDYEIVVKDTNGCISTYSLILDTIPTPRVDSVSTVATTCRLGNGQAEIHPSSGVSPYLYSVDGSAYSSDNLFTGLGYGDHLAVIQDANGCLDSLSFHIDSTAMVQIVDVNQLPSTCEQANGSITILADKGERPYQYSNDNGQTFQLDSIFKDIVSGQYIVHVVDANGCTAIDTVMLDNLAGPELMGATQVYTTCNDADGVISLDASGNGPLAYSIDGGNNFSSDSIFTGLSSGVYQIMIQDTNGCVANATYELLADYNLTQPISITPQSTACAPYEADFFLFPGQNADSCVWRLGDGTVINSCDPFTYNYTRPGCYDVEVFIKTTNGCFGDTTILDQVCVVALPEAEFETYPKHRVTELETIETFNSSYDADSVNWYINGVWVSKDWEPLLKTSMAPFDSVTTICLETFNSFGCVDTVCYQLKTDKEFHWYMPNAFSPNNDGVNEEYKPTFYNIPELRYEFRIFDRWGELVFVTSDVNQAWDGTHHNFPGKVLPQGVYVWKVQFEDPVSGRYVKDMGQVYLIK